MDLNTDNVDKQTAKLCEISILLFKADDFVCLDRLSDASVI